MKTYACQKYYCTCNIKTKFILHTDLYPHYLLTLWAFFIASVALSSPFSSSETTHRTLNSSSPIALSFQSLSHNYFIILFHCKTWSFSQISERKWMMSKWLTRKLGNQSFMMIKEYSDTKWFTVLFTEKKTFIELKKNFENSIWLFIYLFFFTVYTYSHSYIYIFNL